MRHPLEKLTRRGVAWSVLAASLAVSVWLGVKAGGDGRLTLRDGTSQGVIYLELAGSAGRAAEVIDVWREHYLVGAAREAVVYDFFFIPFYATNLALCCLMAGRVLGRGRRRLAAAGVVLAWGQWLAGAFDALENVAMLRMLGAGATEFWARWCWLFAALKFAILVEGSLYALAGLAVWIVGNLRAHGPRPHRSLDEPA
jgi:hypothetical protein